MIFASIAFICCCLVQLSAGQDGISFKLKLQEFTNPNLSVIIDGKSFSCRYETADLDKNCIVYFTLIFTDLSGKIYFKSNPMQWLNGKHQLNMDDGTFDFDNSTYWFGKEIDFTFQNKPQEMLFIVYDIGNFVSDKRLEQGVAIMDYFVSNMTSLVPDTVYNDPLYGIIQKTSRLDFTYSLTCDQEVYGPQCDLRDCKELSGSAYEKYCHSQVNDQPSLCYWETNTRLGLAVSTDKNCTLCPFGFSADECSSYVQGDDTSHMFLDADERAEKYRLATIILGILLGLLLILLIAIIICCAVCSCGKKKKQVYRPNHRFMSSTRGGREPTRADEHHQGTVDPLYSTINKDRSRTGHRPPSSAGYNQSGNRRPSPRTSPNQSAQGSVAGSVSDEYNPLRGTSRSIYV